MDVYACTNHVRQDQVQHGLLSLPGREIIEIEKVIEPVVLFQLEHTSELPGGSSSVRIRWGLRDRVLVLVEWLVTEKEEAG